MKRNQKLVDEITHYVEEHIKSFHDSRINKLKTLKLKNVLKKKNPYLFRAKYMLTADDIVRNLTNAYLSSAEETMFGDWLEGLAIFVSSKTLNGRKSAVTGVDLEFDKNDIRYIVSIKSGPNWGNSSQVKKMREDFSKAKKTLRTSNNSNLNIIAVNGCCYGVDNNPDKGDYFKYCGQNFWALISGNDNLYLDIIEPLAMRAKERNDEFQQLFSQMQNKFTKEFIDEFCLDDGCIDWQKLVKFNSGKKENK
ncbi:MAG: cytosolic protein [Bacteroidales bacterium]|jgi:hypothetical protein|nr:cytosolic protein [Bacteroidales bacterium]